jgi:hypothetical protein
MNSVYYTFYNSKLDIDYFINTNKFKSIVIFYCYERPKLFIGTPQLIHTGLVDIISDENDFIQSRLIKFQPWNFIEQSYDTYIYFDYRIKISKKFISLSSTINTPHFLKHREGGTIRDEFLRIIARDKSPIKTISEYLELPEEKLGLQLSENGVMILTKDLSKAFSDMQSFLQRMGRDQILTPILLKGEKISYFDFDFNNISFFYVRPKRLNFINYLKLLYSEILFALVRYWERFRQC